MALKELKSKTNLYTYQTDLKFNCQRDGVTLKVFDYYMTGMISTYHYETPYMREDWYIFPNGDPNKPAGTKKKPGRACEGEWKLFQPFQHAFSLDQIFIIPLNVPALFQPAL